MPSLKNKFIFGSAGLVAILALSSAVGVIVAWRASRAVEKMLRANYDTLMYCQAMVDATSRLDQAVRAKVAGHDSADWNPAAAEFARNLSNQQANVTEPGEQQLTDGLTRQWADFQGLVSSIRSAPPGRRRRAYELELQPLEARMLRSCHDISGLNLKAV
ncbi:MAG TPA: hypothetical protein VNZ67_07400, partial [bacterium]|nr:hypothetical protein [bacterium]